MTTNLVNWFKLNGYHATIGEDGITFYFQANNSTVIILTDNFEQFEKEPTKYNLIVGDETKGRYKDNIRNLYYMGFKN